MLLQLGSKLFILKIGGKIYHHWNYIDIHDLYVIFSHLLLLVPGGYINSNKCAGTTYYVMNVNAISVPGKVSHPFLDEQPAVEHYLDLGHGKLKARVDPLGQLAITVNIFA